VRPQSLMPLATQRSPTKANIVCTWPRPRDLSMTSWHLLTYSVTVAWHLTVIVAMKKKSAHRRRGGRHSDNTIESEWPHKETILAAVTLSNDVIYC